VGHPVHRGRPAVVGTVVTEADTYLLDIAVRELLRDKPAFVRALRRKVRCPSLPGPLGWAEFVAHVRLRYAALHVTEQDFWASRTEVQAIAAGRRLESLGHPSFLIGSAA
jgi:hypothetical protein